MNALLYRAVGIAAIAGTATFVLACNDDPTRPRVEPPTPAQTIVSSGSQVVTGEIGPGALYAFYMPEDWNGDLILFMRGFAPAAWPVALPDVDPTNGARYRAIRDSALAHHYAFAWSSNSEFGLAVEDAVIRTRQLRGQFFAKFGRPEHTYLWGVSLGAAGALHLAEKNPELFDGVLSECGVVLGLLPIIDQRYNLRVLFDYFYPGVMPGPATRFPDNLDFTRDVQPIVIAAILANPAAAIELGAIDQVRLEYVGFTELMQEIVTSLMLTSVKWMAEEIWTRTNDHPFFDNSTLWYTGSSNDAALNAGVARFTANPSAVNEIAGWHSPSGQLKLPVLMIHTRRDPQVPSKFLARFAELVNEAGSSALLVQRVSDSYGHCALLPSEEVAAMEDLATWVRTGVRPGS